MLPYGKQLLIVTFFTFTEEHFERDRKQQEEISSKEISGGKLNFHDYVKINKSVCMLTTTTACVNNNKEENDIFFYFFGNKYV